jgi:outer membrane biosynthesis protein TonB
VCFGEGKGPVNCGLLNGAAISLPPPEYPRRVKAAGVSVVTVQVHAYINENGRVYLAKGCGMDHPALNRAAIAAAYKASFHRTTCSGKPVRFDGLIVYNFRPRKTHRGSSVGPRITAAWTRRD